MREPHERPVTFRQLRETMASTQAALLLILERNRLPAGVRKELTRIVLDQARVLARAK